MFVPRLPGPSEFSGSMLKTRNDPAVDLREKKPSAEDAGRARSAVLLCVWDASSVWEWDGLGSILSPGLRVPGPLSSLGPYTFQASFYLMPLGR